METLAAVAKNIAKKIAVDLALNKNKRNKGLIIVGSIVAGFLGLMLLPIAVLSAMGDIEPPSFDDHNFDESAFLSSLTPELQEQIADTEADGQTIADAMSAIGLQEQTIKAQLIYMSFFEDNRLTDFTGFSNMFTQENEQLIQSINGYYDLEIDYEAFMRTYVLVMNATINEYMFKDPAVKNSEDLAAWCRNAYVSEWGYAENNYGERYGENRIRSADNVGLIMGYIRYDAENKVFSTDIDTLIYSEIAGIDTMPDVQGIGVYNGSEFGVYVGVGDVIYSSAMGGCVVREPLGNGNWTSWCSFEGISYPQELQERIDEIQNPTEDNTEEETTENGA
jgi:hypothetical protein